jgi:hypothetical protein
MSSIRGSLVAASLHADILFGLLCTFQSLAVALETLRRTPIRIWTSQFPQYQLEVQ